MSAAPPYWRSDHGGVGHVSASTPTKIPAKSSSAAMMLNM
jgi:hypothetical protein